MSSCALISDSSIPFAVSLTGFLASSSRTPDFGFGLLSEPVLDTPSSLPSTSIPWNRSSTLSARTAILEMKNKYSSFDRALLIFDTPAFSGLFPDMEASSAIRCTDEYIRGYLLLVTELVKHFRRQKTGFMLFAVRGSSSPEAKVNLPVAVAESAFMRLAEETASSFVNGALSGDTGFQVLLVKLDPADDTENIDWLSLQLTGTPPARTQVRWVKAGSRGLFGKL
jgi:hypothetical protein